MKMIESGSVFGVVAAICLVLGAAEPASASGVGDIVNYVEYSATLSSSGQPTEAQLEAVAEAGYERVVFLAFTDHHESLANEDRLVKGLGMEYAHVPVDWEAPRISDFQMFAGLMQGEPGKKTLVHCQVNFRASTFSLLYRVLYLDVPLDVAKEDLNSVWVPNDTWRKFIFDVLEENGRSPDCDACLKICVSVVRLIERWPCCFVFGVSRLDPPLVNQALSSFLIVA